MPNSPSDDLYLTRKYGHPTSDDDLTLLLSSLRRAMAQGQVVLTLDRFSHSRVDNATLLAVWAAQDNQFGRLVPGIYNSGRAARWMLGKAHHTPPTPRDHIRERLRAWLSSLIR